LEIFDPMSNAFSSVGVMTSARTSFASAILSDGQVMLIGGSNGSAPIASTEIFDPTNNSVVAGPALSAPRMAHSATTLLDGKVLVAGGTTVITNPDGSTTNTDLASAEIYDPATGNFAVSTSSLAAPRRDHAAFLLPNNNSVLIVGGTSSGNDVGTAEMFVPSMGAFATTGSTSVARQHATGTPLSLDGILFLAGGSNSTGTLSSAELYGFATVKTDKSDYAPGSVVTITGSGWQPGETVTLTLVESPLFDTHPVMTAIADSTGKIVNTDFSPDVHDINIRFYLTAVGSVSGIQAQNTFTDAATSTATILCIPNPVAVNTVTTCTASVKGSGAGQGNPDPSGTVTFSWNGNTTLFSAASGSTFTAPNKCTLNLGAGGSNTSTCSVRYTPNTVGTGTQALAANYLGDTNYPVSSGNTNLTVSGSPLTLSVTGFPTTITAGTAGTFTVMAKDGNNNVAVGYTGTVNFTSSDGAASLPANYTFTAADSGSHTFTNGATLRTVGTQSITATDSVTSSITGAQSGIVVTAGTQSKLGFSVQPTNTNSNSNISPNVAVQVQDSFGNAVAQSGRSITLAIGTNPAGGTLVCGTNPVLTNATGLATFPNCHINNVGTAYTLIASASGSPALTAATSIPFNIVSPITKLGFTTVAASGAINQCLGPITVQTQNSGGTGINPSSAVQVDLSILSGGTGAFFSSNACTSVITSVNIPTTGNSADFFFKAASAGSPIIQAADHAAVLTSATQTETIGKRTTTTVVILTPGSVGVGDASTVGVTVTDGGSGTQSNPQGTIAFTSSDGGDAFGTCTLVSNGGNAAICSATVTPSHVGTSPHSITATFTPAVADTVHQGSSNSPAALLTVTQANQTITFAPLADKNYGDAPFTVSATGGASGNPVTFTAGPGTVCTAGGTNGSTITIVGGGSCTVTAHQIGNSDYKAATDVPQSFTVKQATLTINVTAASTTYAGLPYAGATSCSATGVNNEHPTATPSYQDASHNPLGGAPTNAGSYFLLCSAGGIGTNYVANSSTAGFTIGQATSSVTLTCPTAPQTYTGSALTPCTASYSTSDGLSGTLTVSYTANTNVGTAGATASYVGDANHAGSSKTGSFTISQATSSVTLNCPAAPQTYTGSAQTPCAASYSTSDGLSGLLTVSYTSNINAGTAGASASYAGDTNHAGSSNTGSFTISQAMATVTLSNLTQTYDGTPKSATVTTGPMGLTVNITYSQNNQPVVSPTAAGSYAVVATIVENNYQGSTSGTLVINQANLYVIPNDQTRNFSDANPTVFPASYLGFASGDDAGNSVSGTLACQIAATSTSSAGQYAIHGCSSLSSANYNLVYANGTLTITNPLVSLTVAPATPTIHIGETQSFVAVGTFQQGSRNLGTFGGSWANGSPMPTARTGAAAAEVNGQLYVIGGSDGSAVIDTFDVYNPVTGIWTSPSPALPMGTGRVFARAVALGGQLYVVGGCTVVDCSSGITGALEMYNPGSAWTAKASMPSGTERYDAAVGVINGKLYVAGGHNASGVIGTVEIYDPATDTWTSGHTMTTARSAAAAGVINGLLYVAGGSTGGGPVNTLESYNPVADSWTPLASLGAAQSFAGGAVLNGMLYAVSGVDGGSNSTTTVQAYDPIANSWANQASISTGLYDGQPVAIGGVIYAAGNGSGNTPATTTLQVYSPNEVTWNSAAPSVATIDATGLATGVAAGTSTITGASIPFSSVNGATVLTVIKKVQTITFPALGDKTYGDPDFTVSATSDSGLTVTFMAAGDCTVSVTTVHITGAGSCTITAQQAGNDTYDAAANVPQKFNIAKAHLTVKADDKSKTYDGAVFSPFTATISGFVNGENSGVVSGTPAFTGTAATAVNAGSYTITPVANTLTAANYDFTVFNNGTLTINPAPLTITANDKSKTYGGTDPSFDVSYSGFVNSEGAGVLTGTVVFNFAGKPPTSYGPSTTVPTSAGIYAVRPSGLTSSNYAITFKGGIYTINQATPTVTVTDPMPTYDGNSHAATATAVGVDGHTAVSGSFSLTYDGNAAAPSDAKTSYLVAANFTSSDPNYTNATGNGTLTIKQAGSVTTLTFESGPFTYRGAAFTATAVATGAGSLQVAVTPLYSGDCMNVTTVNGCTATATYAGDTNHTGSADSKSITITQTGSTTTVNCPASVIYNGMAQTPCTANVTGVGGLNLVVNVSYNDNINAGTATASATFAGDTNHKTSSDSKNFTINPAPSTTLVTFEVGPYTYRGTAFTAMAAVSGAGNLSAPVAVGYTGDCVNVTIAGCTATANFAGDVNHAASGDMKTIIIAPASTTTTVSSSQNTSDWSQVVTFTAIVSDTSTGAAPMGSVSFYNAGSGATCASLGTSTYLDNTPLSTTSPYQASTSTPNLPVGPGNTVGIDNILACFNSKSGDPGFNPNANFIPSYGTFTQTVNPAPIATLVPSSLSFGNQQGGTTSGAQIATLCNGPSGADPNSPCFTAPVATAPLAISSITLVGTNANYFTQTPSCPSSVAVGGSCAISVKFAPPVNASGVATALLNVTDNSGHVGGTTTQSTTITGAGVSSINSVGSLSTYALFATANGCSSFNMSGNATVDSFSAGAGNNHGNVGTNGNATLSGNTVINGAVYSPNGGTGNCSSKSLTGLSTSGKAQTGGLQTLSGSVAYPAPSAPNPAPPTTTQNIAGSCGTISGCTNSGTKNAILAPGQYGNLSASGGMTVHVTMGTYNLNSLTLSGNSTLVVDAGGPVVFNIAGKSITGGNAVLDLSGGVMSNASGMASNLQFYYAGFQPIKLSGGTGSYAVVYAPNAAINVSGGSHFYGNMIGSTINNSGGTAIHYDVNLPNIAGGNYIWFNSAALNVKGLPASGTTKLYVTNSTINFTANGTPYSLAVPNAVITFSSTATSTTTTWDATNNRWSVLVPTANVSGSATIHSFLDGLAFPVPSGGFPTGIQNVTWSAAFSTTLTGLSFNWQWGAAVYSAFPGSTTGGAFPPSTVGDYNLAGVNPIDNADPAGTPVSYKTSLVFGATGPGFTGLYTSAAGVVPTIAEASASPSSLDFSNGGTVSQTVSTTSSPLTAVLTNNMSGPLAISSIAITGTNMGDFAQTNNCPVAPNSTLASGYSCSITVTFTPSASGKRTAKIAVTDSANNSPQTVFLKGTAP
jgi:hypothetical protein